jgi:hypothetical protein
VAKLIQPRSDFFPTRFVRCANVVNGYGLAIAIHGNVNGQILGLPFQRCQRNPLFVCRQNLSVVHDIVTARNRIKRNALPAASPAPCYDHDVPLGEMDVPDEI